MQVFKYNRPMEEMMAVVPFPFCRPAGVKPVGLPEKAVMAMLEDGRRQLAELTPGTDAYRELEATLQAAERELADD